jgi:Arc/MetJ-type ribon-helix-helix transcriptional regulator
MRIELPDQTVRDVEAMLAQRGERSDVSAFVDRTLQRALFFEAVREVKKQNAGVDASVLDQLIDEAVKAARSERGKADRHADGA